MSSQVVEEEGVYAGGSVTVQPYPLEVWGSTAHRTAPLRRLEAVVGDDEGQEFCSRELAKVRSFQGLDIFTVCCCREAHLCICRCGTCFANLPFNLD